MNFDEYINRYEYPTLKWSKSFLKKYFGNGDALPMSVADMDLKAPPTVIEALHQRVSHGIYGYEYRPDGYFEALQAWYQTRYGWKIEREQIEFSPSILSAIAILIARHSDEGDGVIIQPPVFFEFRMVIRNNRRKVVTNPLKLVEGQYQIDFEDLERKASRPENKVLILCTPHNPVGRVWTKVELARVAKICERHEVFVIADEIHGDFTFPPHQFVPYLTVTEGGNAAVCLSPAKTFNISGIVDAFIVIPDEEHRRQFHEFTHRYQMNKVNVFAAAALEAAYRNGGKWLDALLVYLKGNVDFIRKYLRQNNIGVSLIEPEGTFLVWLDFRELGLTAEELKNFLAFEAQLALAPGYWFGREGTGFARMTIGCPRSTIQKALDNLTKAVSKLYKRDG